MNKRKYNKKDKQLRLLTINDAKHAYINNIPIKYYSFQTYDGKDIDDNPPHLRSKDVGTPELFIPDATLIKIEKGKPKERILNWLDSDIKGPYKKEEESRILYYLEGWSNIEKTIPKTVQICSMPLNILSEDCLDEINLWCLDKNNQ